MKTIFGLICCVVISNVSAQFFVQKLDQTQILNPEQFYIINNEGDTIRGKLGGVTFTDSLITSVVVKNGDSKTKYRISDIEKLAVIPGDQADYDEMALNKIIKNLDNDEFIKVLPEGGWVFYERIRLPGKRERYELAQLLNPGFDSEIKVYAHPDATDSGSTSINGLTVGGLNDNQHYVTLREGQAFVMNNFNYRKKANERLYNNCEALSSQKLKWKDFATHVFTYDQDCN
ncbi:hypothetical protein [Ekhidna sp.]|uniref:hypothetical protein n=1 Tax=Ekhidna sp. TaxID=2608089 RepID=UPI003CCBE870